MSRDQIKLKHSVQRNSKPHKETAYKMEKIFTYLPEGPEYVKKKKSSQLQNWWNHNNKKDKDKTKPTSATRDLQVTTTIRNQFLKPRTAIKKSADKEVENGLMYC